MTAAYFLGANWVFQTVTFDEFMWMVALYWFLCVVLEGKPRHWIYLGISLGIGLEVKFTILGLIAGIGLAALLTPSLRAALRTRYPWIAAGIALLIWAPNLAWQVANGFPTVAYVTNHQGSGGGPVVYLIELGVYLFFLLPLWAAGFVFLFRDPRLRAIGIACALPLVAFLFVGKSYYAVGTVPIVLAQGVMALSRIKRPRLRRGLQIAAAVACVLQFVTFALITLPITPPDRIHALGLDTQNELFADSVGWEDVAHQVQKIYTGLPDNERSSAVIISAYYGVPGALEIYGDQEGASRRREPTAQRLVLAAQQPQRGLRADGRLPAFGCHLHVRLATAHRASHGSVRGERPRARRTGHPVPAQRPDLRLLGTPTRLRLIPPTRPGCTGSAQRNRQRTARRKPARRAARR